ncbi:MAG: type II toxin-antitoxin system Phd/YefM family antitoxin [Alphaproteobacteria bacterium]
MRPNATTGRHKRSCPFLRECGEALGLGDHGKIGGRVVAEPVRKPGVRQVPLSVIKDDLSRFLREAGKEEIVITRHGKPAGVLIGFDSEDDWFEYRLETDPRFLRRVEKARASLRAGRGVRLEDVNSK